MRAMSLQSCPTLCDPMDYSPPGSSVHGVLQARILEWVARLSSRESCWPRDQTCVSYVLCIGSWVLTTSTTWEVCIHIQTHTRVYMYVYVSFIVLDYMYQLPYKQYKMSLKETLGDPHPGYISRENSNSKWYMYPSVQFSSVTQSCLTFCDPMNCSTPALPVHHQLPEPTQTHVHWVGDAIQLSHPLSSPSPPALSLAQHQGLFKWVSSSHEVAKVMEFQLQHQSFQWTPRTDLL